VDVNAEIDLIEELARLRGYAAFPDEVRAYRPGNVRGDAVHQISRLLRTRLCGAGLFEVRPLPFVRGGDSHVRVANPVSEDEGCLRRSVLETLRGRVEYNLSQMQGNIRLFEIGNVFAPASQVQQMPSEATHVGAVIMGDRYPAHFSNPNPPHFDEWDAKALAESTAGFLFPNSTRELRSHPDHGTALWSIIIDGTDLGSVSRLELDAPPWAAPAFGVELRIAEVSSQPVAPPGNNGWLPATVMGGEDLRSEQGRARRRRQPRYSPLPTQPATDFDLALIVPDSVTAAQVGGLLTRVAGDLLESLVLFDEFRGEGLPPGTRSLAWRLTFRHHDRTLRDKEVEARRQKLLTVLEKDLGVRQR
jgi:phenylalanyl-tRNA synthetase beta chain